jgi:small conductance mechanosensitive channel
MDIILPIVKTIAFAIVVLVVGLFILKYISKILKKQIQKSKLDDSLKPFLVSGIDISLKILLVLSVISILGIDITSFAAILASAGFAIGLAFQGSLANFAGGILLLTLRPFKVGDFIEGAGYSGTVKEIRILYTELATVDNKAVLIPNADLSNASIINYSKNSTRRADLKFNVRYDSNNKHVVNILNSVVNAHESVLKDPEPFVRITAYGDSSVEYTVRVWAKSEDYWGMYFDILEQVKILFEKEEILIPYPQMNINMNK